MSIEEFVFIEEILFPLGEKFRSSLLEMSDQASDLLGQSDFHALGRVGHSMRGTAGYFGADGIKALASDLERAALDKDVAVASAVIAELNRLLKAMVLRSRADLPPG